MTGAPRHLSIDGDFVLLRMALIDEVGLPAAVVFQRIAWRCELRTDGWHASQAELAAECHLGLDQVKRATKLLRDRGWITADRVDQWDATLSWAPVWKPASREVENPLLDEGGTTPPEEGETSFTSYETDETSRDDSSSPADAGDGDQRRDDVERLCAHLADRIEQNGSKRPTITKAWRTAARLLIDRDKHTEDKVHKAIDWCQGDEFWRTNILSMPTLRKRYDQLRLHALRAQSGGRRPDWSSTVERGDGSAAGVVAAGGW